MTFPIDQLPQEIMKALEEGRVIDAIKQMRKLKGIGLAEAKAIVEAAKKSRSQQGSSFGQAHATHESADSGRVLPDSVMEALQRGDRQAAIRELRERTGIGLNEAKKRIEAAHVFTPAVAVDVPIPRSQPIPTAPRSGMAPGEVRHSNAPFWLVMALVAVLAAYYLLF